MVSACGGGSGDGGGFEVVAIFWQACRGSGDTASRPPPCPLATELEHKDLRYRGVEDGSMVVVVVVVVVRRHGIKTRGHKRRHS